MKSDYEENGYLIVEGLLSPQEIDMLRLETPAIDFPYKVYTAIEGVVSFPKISNILDQLLNSNVKALQAIPQDESYTATRDKSLINVWIVIEDTDIVKSGSVVFFHGSTLR